MSDERQAFERQMAEVDAEIVRLRGREAGAVHEGGVDFTEAARLWQLRESAEREIARLG